jgi:hypothetical protein
LGEIDRRQEKFFRNLLPQDIKGVRPYPPDKLIVATCAPTTVFGKYARVEDKKSAQTFYSLGLKWLFWTGHKYFDSKTIRDAADWPPSNLTDDGPGDKIGGEIQKGDTGKGESSTVVFDASQTELSDKELEGEERRLGRLLPRNPTDLPIEEGQCRLDVSGDVHLYARYWGPESHRGGSAGHRPSSDNYASVVSGAGGAFHHPSFTSGSEIAEQAIYPDKTVSLHAVADRVLNPYRIARGGSVWLLGFLIAFSMYFGALLFAQ